MAMGPGVDINQLMQMFGGGGGMAQSGPSNSGMGWLGQLGSGMGSGGFWNVLSGLGGIGSLLGGQGFQQGGFMGLPFGGGSSFGGVSGMSIPDEMKITQTQDWDMSRRMRNYLQWLMPQQFQHELSMQGGMGDILQQLQASAERLGMADIDLREVLGLGGLDVSREGIASGERLGFGSQDVERDLGMRGFDSADTRSQLLAQALMGIFGGGVPSGMTQASQGQAGQAGRPMAGGGMAPQGGDFYSGVEAMIQSDLMKPTTLDPKDYAGIASRGSAVIDKQGQNAAAAANRNNQRSGLGFDTGSMNQLARIGAETKGQFANNLADAEISDRMQTAQRRPGYFNQLQGIAGDRTRNRQFTQNMLSPYLGMI